MNLTYCRDQKQLTQAKEQIKRIFFYRICGTGMAAVAYLFKEKGYIVEGGDKEFYPPMSTYLEKTNIPCHSFADIKEDYLKTFDLIVVGNVVAKNSDDARFIESLGVPFTSFPNALGALILREENVVGISGTHGKTTTTYLMVQLFEGAGFSPGYLVGGVLEGRPSSRLGDGSYFFIESDEYDSAYFQKISKFHSYCIDHLILTSLEFDHADIFKNVEEIENEFEKLIYSIQESFIANKSYPSITKLNQKLEDALQKRKTQFYGQTSDVGPFVYSQGPQGSEFGLLVQGKELKFKTNLVGEHNILNLSAAVLFALQERIPVETIQKAILDLKMVKRRQELRGIYQKALIIDDFAHHPRAVQTTIEGIKKKYPKHELLVVFEPNSATSRSSVFQKEFRESLEKADSIVLAKPTRPSNIEGYSDIDCFQMAKELNTKNFEKASVAINLTELLGKIDAYIEKTSKKGENGNARPLAILIMSNNTCLGLWNSRLSHEMVNP